MSIVACSKGAEVYSMVWAIRSARPDLQLNLHAVDISQEILDFAATGVYSLSRADALDRSSERPGEQIGTISWNTSRHQNASLFERMSSDELETMFDVQGNQARVRPWLKEGITWCQGDAGDPGLLKIIGGPQEIVVANRFLCHMEPKVASQCLRSVSQLVKRGGYLFVTGVDLNVRTSVARELGWIPVTELLRETHEGDSSIRQGWPLNYWGLEPFDRRRPDWQIRYASVFQVGKAS
jgi:chemotaxis methyl-accepting protein methylase